MLVVGHPLFARNDGIGRNSRCSAADTVLIVVEAYFKSLETGRRVAELAKDLGIDRVALIANKVRDDRDLEAAQEFAAQNGLEIACVVPYDPTFTEAEREGVAPLDHAPDRPAVVALGELARDPAPTRA